MNKLLIAGVILSLALSSVALLSKDTVPFGGTTEDFFDAKGGFVVNGTTTIDSTGQWVGPINSSTTVFVTGETNLSQLIYGGATTTITATDTDLTAAEFCNNSIIFQTPTASTSNLHTPTAAAMIADCIPVDGDEAVGFTLSNQALGIGSAITIVASTSVTLVEPSGGNVVLSDGEFLDINCENVNGTTVVCKVVDYQDAD